MKKICLILGLIVCITCTFYPGIAFGESTGADSKTERSTEQKLPSPTNVKVSKVNGEALKLTWNKVSGASGYKIYRCNTKDGSYKHMYTVKGSSCIDKSVYKGRPFYYKVQAYKEGNRSVTSKLSYPVVYYMKPAAPVIKTQNNNGDIKVSWNKVYGAQKYHVYIYSSKEKKYLKIGETKKLSFTHTKAMHNTFLYYRVSAVYECNGKVLKSSKSSYSKVLSRYVNPDKKMVALTFDDGPSKYTKSIVNCLYKYDSAATFFVVGNRIESYKETVKYTYSRGCELANHSYSHPIFTNLTTEEIKSQIKKTDIKIKSVTGSAPALVRVPGGGYNDKVRSAVNKPIIQWSDDTLDWKTRSKSATVNYVMNNVQDGDVVLMHDLHEPTKYAALELIPKLKAKGYQIVTVSELAKYKGYKLNNGTVYFSFR